MPGLHPWWPDGAPLWLHPHLVFEVFGWAAGLVVLLVQRRDPRPLPARSRQILAVAALFGGLAGAKVLFWLTDPWSLLASLEPALLIGGKTIVGGLLGAIAAVELTKIPLGIRRSTGDVYVYPLLAGLMFGRLGCFFSGVADGTHGVATSAPLGMDLGDGVLRHPTALYEIGFLLLLGAVLAAYGRRGLPGDRFAGLVVAYLGYRLLAESLKTQPGWVLGLSAIQVACVVGLVAYAMALPRRIRRAKVGSAEGE